MKGTWGLAGSKSCQQTAEGKSECRRPRGRKMRSGVRTWAGVFIIVAKVVRFDKGKKQMNHEFEKTKRIESSAFKK